MRGCTFRINTPMPAIRSDDGTRTPLLIPANSIVKVMGCPLDGDRFVDVEWDGRTVTVFTIDLKERGTEIRE